VLYYVRYRDMRRLAMFSSLNCTMSMEGTALMVRRLVFVFGYP
jgi:hypothetical protein